MLEEKDFRIDREFHPSDAQDSLDAFGLHRYREARSFGVDLDRDLHHSDHLLPTFDLLRTLLGERDEGVMRNYAKRIKRLLQAC